MTVRERLKSLFHDEILFELGRPPYRDSDFKKLGTQIQAGPLRGGQVNLKSNSVSIQNELNHPSLLCEAGGIAYRKRIGIGEGRENGFQGSIFAGVT